jgi:hypothetical protein
MSDDNLNNENLELNSDTQDIPKETGKKSLEKDKLEALKMLSKKTERSETENLDERPIKKMSLDIIPSAFHPNTEITSELPAEETLPQEVIMSSHTLIVREEKLVEVINDQPSVLEEISQVKETHEIQPIQASDTTENIKSVENITELTLPKLNPINIPTNPVPSEQMQVDDSTTKEPEKEVSKPAEEIQTISAPEPVKNEQPVSELTESHTNEKSGITSPIPLPGNTDNPVKEPEQVVHTEVPVGSKQSETNVSNIESNIPKPVENPTGAKKLSFSAAKKEIDDFAVLMDTIIVELKDKGINIPETTYDEYLPDEVKIKLIEEFFNDKEIQKLAKESSS